MSLYGCTQHLLPCTPPSPAKKVRKREQEQMAKAIIEQSGAGEWAPQALEHLLTWLGQVNSVLRGLEEHTISQHNITLGWVTPTDRAACAYVVCFQSPNGLISEHVPPHTALMLPYCPANVVPSECNNQHWLDYNKWHKGGLQLH